MSSHNYISKTILFSGGGTGGSITPLLAVAEELAHNSNKFNVNLIFVGNHFGPDRDMVASFNENIAPLKFIPLISGKWRRYFSWKNFGDIFRIIIAYFKSFSLLKREGPDVIISAGGFVSVPLIWAAASKGIPVLIHQQDSRPGLANLLTARFARVITVTFEKSLADYGPKAVWIGNPVKSLKTLSLSADIRAIKSKYNLVNSRPLLMIIGGGTGAVAINDLIFSAKQSLTQFFQVIHLTGSGKLPKDDPVPYYHTQETLPQQNLLELMSVADIVISRCGLATLSELSALDKVAILIPIPNSHQEDNALIFAQQKAAVVLKQKELNPEKLATEIKQLWDNGTLRTELKNNIGKVIKRGANLAMLDIILEILGQSKQKIK